MGSVDNGIFIHAIVPRHVETVVQLSKGNISTQNVRVEFSLEDMDMSGFSKGLHMSRSRRGCRRSTDSM